MIDRLAYKQSKGDTRTQYRYFGYQFVMEYMQKRFEWDHGMF